MNRAATLLMDIEHPGLTEPLRLMCGCGFSLLRTDSTGRDIYGFAHQGREYLLVPFSFATDGENRLIMTLPAMYEEWFENMNVSGARIHFASPHGEPPFAALAGEYQSGSGMLDIDGQGVVRITMDRADPALHASDRACGGRTEESEEARSGHSETCACGHRHQDSGGSGPAAPAGGHAQHHHEQAAIIRVSMNDQELAGAIRKRTDGLNLLLKQAAASGLEVELAFIRNNEADYDAPGHPLLAVKKIARPL